MKRLFTFASGESYVQRRSRTQSTKSCSKGSVCGRVSESIYAHAVQKEICPTFGARRALKRQTKASKWTIAGQYRAPGRFLCKTMFVYSRIQIKVYRVQYWVQSLWSESLVSVQLPSNTLFPQMAASSGPWNGKCNNERLHAQVKETEMQIHSFVCFAFDFPLKGS